MKPPKILLSLILTIPVLFLLLCHQLLLTPSQAQKQPKADLILLNGRVLTLNDKNMYARALAIDNDRIIYVGSNTEVMKYFEQGQTQIIDLGGRPAIPGFNDAHLHFVSGGLSLLRVNLTGCKTKTEIVRKLKQKMKITPKGNWIVGRGWDHTLFNQGKWPDKKYLDEITPFHPVYLTRIDGHVAWVNSLALKEANLTIDTPDPPGGEIVRNLQGFPTGILKENATDLVANIIPPPTPEDYSKAIREALKEAKKNGITSIQDNSDLQALKIYQTLAEQGNLTVRVNEWLPFEWIKTPEKLDSLKNSFSYWHPLVKLGPLKGYADGTLGSRTAYLFEPYSDDSSTKGIPQYTQEELDSLILKAEMRGYQICFHAIGDQANYMVLKAYEKAINTFGRLDTRHRIEHAQVLRLADIPLFAQIGVIASMQPTHCTSDKRWAEARLGKERCWGAYAWQTLLLKKAHLAFGTDWPVEPLNPLHGIYAAVTRKDLETKEPKGGWYAAEKLSIFEAIRAYTLGSAFAEFQENEKGILEVGKLADIVVLSKDIFALSYDEILNTKVDYTIFDGQIIYDREAEEGK